MRSWFLQLLFPPPWQGTLVQFALSSDIAYFIGVWFVPPICHMNELRQIFIHKTLPKAIFKILCNIPLFSQTYVVFTSWCILKRQTAANASSLASTKTCNCPTESNNFDDKQSVILNDLICLNSFYHMIHFLCRSVGIGSSQSSLCILNQYYGTFENRNGSLRSIYTKWIEEYHPYFQQHDDY